MSVISIVWKDTDGCAKQYKCALAIYLINLLSSSYVIIMDCSINATAHEKHFLMDQYNGQTLFERVNGTYW